jgi:hypothetical protein
LEILRVCSLFTDEECAYLKTSFVATERMWSENLAKVTTVRLVMLSEAPLEEGDILNNMMRQFKAPARVEH